MVLEIFLLSIFQYLKEWTPLWLAIFAFLLNAYNQNLKNYQLIKKEARLYFLKHRMLLDPLIEILDSYQISIERNKTGFTELLSNGSIKEINLNQHSDFNEERVIGYCVYNRVGSEKELFKQYVNMIYKYEQLIYCANSFEESMSYFFSKQNEQTTTFLFDSYWDFMNTAKIKGFFIEVENKKIDHPLNNRIYDECQELERYLLLPAFDYEEFKTDFIQKIEEIYSNYLTQNLHIVKRDLLKEKYDQVVEQFNKSISNIEIIEEYPIEYVKKPLNELLTMFDKIESTPLKGYKIYGLFQSK